MTFIIDASTVLLSGLIWLGIVIFLRLKKRKSPVYLFFFTLFFLYVFKVLDYTLFQFQSLILLKHVMPNLLLRGVPPGESLNLVPLVTLTPEDLKTSLLNILLMVPFGFGLPFISGLRMKRITGIAALVSIGIELLQLVTGFLAHVTFRIADINDVIFNTAGATAGYVLFLGFMRLFHHAFRNRKIRNPFLRYIAEQPQADERSSGQF